MTSLCSLSWCTDNTHYRAHKHPALFHVLYRLNPVPILIPQFVNIHYNIRFYRTQLTTLFRKIVEVLNELFKVTERILPLFCLTYRVECDRYEINIKFWSDIVKEKELFGITRRRIISELMLKKLQLVNLDRIIWLRIVLNTITNLQVWRQGMDCSFPVLCLVSSLFEHSNADSWNFILNKRLLASEVLPFGDGLKWSFINSLPEYFRHSIDI